MKYLHRSYLRYTVMAILSLAICALCLMNHLLLAILVFPVAVWYFIKKFKPAVDGL